MGDEIITVEGLGKKYRLGARNSGERYTALRDVISDKARAIFRNPRSAIRNGSDGETDFWALKDVSFEVRQGEVLGIIGRNGAGKSTLLKILSRITEPTEGRIKIRGRVASLLEVGTGFHPELTGRENVFLNGAILGMHRAEIKGKFDEIVGFAEVEKFLDTPVKRYSSGMYVRLAFAVAAHLNPEILIVDEVLAVGDTEFQRKCLRKMDDVAKGGRTVILVSHNISAVRNLCEKALYLKSGRMISLDTTSIIVSEYLRETRQPHSCTTVETHLGDALWIRDFAFIPNPAESTEPLRFTLELIAKEPTRITELAILVYSGSGQRVAILDLRSERGNRIGKEAFRLHGTIERLPLVEGDYEIGLYISCDWFRKDFLNLATLEILAPSRSASSNIPYPSEYRGYVNLDFTLAR